MRRGGWRVRGGAGRCVPWGEREVKLIRYKNSITYVSVIESLNIFTFIYSYISSF